MNFHYRLGHLNFCLMKKNTHNNFVHILPGQGIYIWKNGDIFEGTFNNDQLTGQGFYIFKSGDRYEGQMDNWKRSGAHPVTSLGTTSSRA